MMKCIFKSIGLPSLLVLLMLFSAYPYLFCYFLGFPSESIMIVSFLCIFLFYSICTKNRGQFIIPYIGGIMVVQIIVWVIYSLIHNDSSYLVRVLLLFETYFAISLLSKKNAVLRFANIYNWSLMIQGALGCLAFFLLFMGLISPIAEYHFNSSRYELCYLLTCSNSVQDNFMRVGGYFDEPGALAYWGVFALVINKLTYNNKLIEYVLLFSLLFTFSAAYFVLLPIYIICFYHSHIRNFIIGLIICIPLLFITWNYLSDSYDVVLYTTARFEGGSIQSTRFEQSKIAKKLFMESPILGNGAREISENHANAEENPYETLAKDGIIGYFFTYLPLFFLFYKYRKDKQAMFGSLMLFIDYLQRPFHVNQMQFFMLYFFCSLVILRNKYKIYDAKLQESLS